MLTSGEREERDQAISTQFISRFNTYSFSDEHCSDENCNTYDLLIYRTRMASLLPASLGSIVYTIYSTTSGNITVLRPAG